MEGWYQSEDTKHMIVDQKPNLKLIETIRSESNLFALIVSSLCPQIHGHSLVKSGLVLALFGGVHKHDRQSKSLSVRANIHILLFGDHGSNKDLLLKAVHSMAPNAHYICGNTSNRNSLTTSVKRNRTQNNFQKGCLESKKNAICCFDEFERMDGSQHQIIEEVMEYETLSYYCDTIRKEMSANTSIIAAVNPLNGYYNWSSNVWENTRLSKSLISKFDLIFVLVDTPDEEMDSKLSKEILDSREYENNDTNVLPKLNFFSQTTPQKDCQLMSKFNVIPNEELDLIPPHLLKQYISYAQMFVHPVLNSEARDLLEDFCTEFESSLICKSQTRNIDTLYRLTEARARVELRPEATKEDVLDVIDIVRYSVGKYYRIANVVNSLNTMLSFKSSKKSQNSKNLLKALRIVCEQKQQKEFSFGEIVEICRQFEIPFDSNDEIYVSVERLNEQSFLLKTNSNYKLLID